MYACSEDADDKTLAPEEGIRLTTWHLWFPEAGGTLPVAVSATADWGSTTDSEWIAVTDEQDGIQISVSANDSGTPRAGYVYVKTLHLRDSVFVEQSAESSADLSAEAAANCYMAKPGKTYKFNGRVKGNGGTDGGSSYVEYCGATIEGELAADLLWEATFDGDKTRSRGIIDGAPVFKDDYVYFRTGKIEGNAVIAVRSAAGDIMWSWHIWVLADEVQTEEGNGLQWMDRNLGALNNTPADRNNRGMMYQWGRKDPFLPTYIPYDGLYATALRYNPDNTETGDGSMSWNYSDFMAMRLIAAPGHIPFSVEKPTTYIKYFGTLMVGTMDWYLSEFNEDTSNSCLWGNFDDSSEKSMFDPCPPGYIMPPGDAFELKGSGTSERNQWTVNSQKCEEFDFGVKWTDCNDAYFPLAGHRVGHSGELTYCGNIGDYWTRRPARNEPEAHMSYFNIMQNPDNPEYLTPILTEVNGRTGARVSALTVRCVKQ